MIVSLLLLAAWSHLSAGQYDECFPNEVPVPAINPCGTCDQRGYCPQEEPGCDCAPGLLRNLLGQCVAPDACYQGLAPRSYGRPPVPPKRCEGPFEEFLSCGTACPPACVGNDPRPQPCPLQCASGCFCVEGRVRDWLGGCVRPDECNRILPPVPPPRPRCGPNEEYTDCGTACPPTCQLRNPLCDLQCVAGCFCRRGFVRFGGRCVPLQDCPPIPRPPPPPVRDSYPVPALPPARPPLPPALDCPDRRKCVAACKRRGSLTGFCIGDAFKTCACHG